MADWLFQDTIAKRDLRVVNGTGKLLGTSWLRHRKKLFHPYSPLQKIVDHQNFVHLGPAYTRWAAVGFTRFVDLLRKVQLPLPEYFASRVEDFNIM